MQAGQHHEGAGRRHGADRLREALEGPQQDVGEHEMIRRAVAKAAVAEAACVDHGEPGGTVEARILPRQPHADGIDVAGEHCAAQGPRRRDREHPGPGADIEDAAAAPPCRVRRPPARLQDGVQRQQTAPGGAVMPGAEGERRLDLDADAVGRHPRAVVRAMQEEAAGFDRLQAFEAGGDPVARRNALECELAARAFAREVTDEAAHRGLVGRALEMDFHGPASVTRLEGGDRGLPGVEHF